MSTRKYFHQTFLTLTSLLLLVSCDAATQSNNPTTTASISAPTGIQATTVIVPTTSVVPTVILPSPTLSPPTPEPNYLDQHVYENGYVEFSNSNTLPNQTYRIRGKIKVTLWEGFAKIETQNEVFYVPRDRIIYIGQEIP